MPTCIAASMRSPKRSTNCTRGRGRRSGPSSTPPASRARTTAPPRPSRSSSLPARPTRSISSPRSWGDANVRAGDEILLTEMEHHSNLVPWYQLAARTGAVVRHIPLTDDGRLQLDALDRLLTKRTKLVAVAAVSNVLGTINPVAEIIRRAHDVGAVVLVDAAQSVPHQKTDVQALDCDFLAFSGHKMLGPSGVGVLYGKRELLEAMPPFMGGGGMIKEVTLEGFQAAAILPGEVRGRHAADRAGRGPGRGHRLSRTPSAWRPSRSTSGG